MKHGKTSRGTCRGLEAQNDKEGKGCRRQKLRVTRRAGGAGTRSIVRQGGQKVQGLEA